MSGILASLPGAGAQGIIWGIMAVGVVSTFKVLDLADLTVDGSFGTGGAVLVVCTIAGMNIWLAMLLAFLAGVSPNWLPGICIPSLAYRRSWQVFISWRCIP